MPLYTAIMKNVLLSSPHAKPCTLLLPAIQRALYATHTQPQFQNMRNPLRCMESLKAEHYRIKCTMHSFERMLDAMHVDIEAGNVRASRLKDLKKFMTFCHLYSYHHDVKEEMLFAYAQLKQDKPALQKLCSDHKHGRNLYTMMDEAKKSVPEGTNPEEELLLPSKAFISNLYAHMQTEDERIYPQLEQQLDESDMELLSQKTDEFDAWNANTIDAMHFLSDELNAKYS